MIRSDGEGLCPNRIMAISMKYGDEVEGDMIFEGVTIIHTSDMH